MKVSKSIRDLHSDLEETANLVEKHVRELLCEYCDTKKWMFNCRSKEKISFAQKLETGIYSSKEDIDDFFGCEIVVPNLQQIEEAKKYVSDNFEVVYERPDETMPASQFSFDGIRMYVKVKPGVAGKIYSWMLFEVQIKTLLEKAWGEATHDFTYKCKDIRWAKERLVFQMKALLSHADIILADAGNISQSPLLDKQYDKYTELNKISEWVASVWDSTECPENMKRLSETIYKLSRQYDAPLESIKKTVTEYIKNNGSVKNLSVYATILQALFDKADDAFLKKANSGYSSRCKDLKLFIPKEVYIKDNIERNLNKTRCVFLKNITQ